MPLAIDNPALWPRFTFYTSRLLSDETALGTASVPARFWDVKKELRRMNVKA
jgi:hypothetical protein